MSLGALAALLCLAPVGAAAQVSVEVSPLRIELTGAPGSSHTQAITLTNQGAAPIRIRATADDWYLSKDGTPQFEPAPPGTWSSAAGWMRLAPPEQVVEPGRQGVVRFTLTVPPGTEPAGYRAAVMFEFADPAADPAARGRQMTFRSRVATVVYATVGQPTIAVDLTNLVVRAADGKPPEIVATLDNTGRVHVRTKGFLTIYDQSGAVVRQVDLPSAPVLPESERDVAIPTGGDTDPPLAPGTYRVEVKIDVGLRALLVGETVLTIAR